MELFIMLANQFSEVEAMKGYDQKNDFHLLTLDKHTERVMGNLVEEDMPYPDLLQVAGALHDIGKCSEEGCQIHPKDPEKRRYLGHEKVSEEMAGKILPRVEIRGRRLSGTEQGFVAGMIGLHSSAFGLLNSFSANPEPKGKKLKPYDKFLKELERVPFPQGENLEEKVRVVFAFNRADKKAGWDENSDPGKAEEIIKQAEKELALLDELEKAIPAIIEAVRAKRNGSQKAGIEKTENGYRLIA